MCQQQHWKPADNGVLPENTEGKWFQLSLINIFRHIKSQNKKRTFSKEGNENYALPKKVNRKDNMKTESNIKKTEEIPIIEKVKGMKRLKR